MAGIIVEGEKVRELTTEEIRAIRALQRLERIWPQSLWLFSAAGTLTVMQADEQGDHVLERRGGSVNRDYIVTTVGIPNSGGDW